MSFGVLLALFMVMLTLASFPTASSLLVAGRSMTSGPGHGVAAAAGVVAGDVVLMVAAIYALSVVMAALSEYGSAVKLVAGVVLLWLGWQTLRGGAGSAASLAGVPGNLAGSFLGGLLITLADHKAILFYLGFFPTFVDVDALSGREGLLLVAVAALAVGIPKLGYALAARRLGSWRTRAGVRQALPAIAGVMVMMIGVLLIWQTL